MKKEVDLCDLCYTEKNREYIAKYKCNICGKTLCHDHGIGYSIRILKYEHTSIAGKSVGYSCNVPECMNQMVAKLKEKYEAV